MAWVRWSLAADGPGPGHCRQCQVARQSSERCATCPEPALLPEAVPIAQAWTAVQTQWRVGMSGPTGLDYAGVEAAVRLLAVDEPREVFAGLRLCESAALEALRERREREQLHQLLGGG